MLSDTAIAREHHLVALAHLEAVRVRGTVGRAVLALHEAHHDEVWKMRLRLPERSTKCVSGVVNGVCTGGQWGYGPCADYGRLRLSQGNGAPLASTESQSPARNESPLKFRGRNLRLGVRRTRAVRSKPGRALQHADTELRTDFVKVLSNGTWARLRAGFAGRGGQAKMAIHPHRTWVQP